MYVIESNECRWAVEESSWGKAWTFDLDLVTRDELYMPSRLAPGSIRRNGSSSLEKTMP